MRLPHAAALLVVLSLAWISPPPASAQLGSLIVTITSPTSGSTVSGTIPVSADVSIVGSLTVTGVQFYVDEVPLGTEDTTEPYSRPWDTTTTSNGPHTVTAVARDLLGVRYASDPVTVTVSNADTAPPTVVMTAPESGATVSGPITVSAEAMDDVGVTVVEFLVDGAVIGQDTTAPYSVAWDTMTVPDGAHTLTARARDAVGNTTTSAEVGVTVANGATVTRIEEISTAVTYTGSWGQGNTDREWSGGTAAVSTEALARATLTFTGTGVSWIGFRGPQAGIARIFLDGTQVATVDAFAPTEAVQAVLFTASGLTAAEHTLAIEVTGTKNDLSSDFFVVVDAFDVPSGGGGAGETFAPGEVFVSLETGPVQWWHPDGTLTMVLGGTIAGTGEGMGFDAGGNLYVTRWCIDPSCSTGNTVEVFNVHGLSLGAFGSGYNCHPHAIVFDGAGTAYVGQAGCTGAILKLVPGQPPVELAVAPDNQGSFWIDLAADGCTIFYTSWGPNVKRFDGCARVQLPDFNGAPLPGGETQDLRVLPDGGVLVSSGQVIARLDASGVLVQTYEVPGESSPWAGLDLVGDGTFWAANYESSNVYRFDLATGAVLSSFNTGTPPHTAVGVSIKK